MTVEQSWPGAELLTTPRLLLEPLREEHAQEAFGVFNDVRLHAWTGGAPPASLEKLEAQYRRQSTGQSPDGRQGWLNWILRLRHGSPVVGTVQATLRAPSPGVTEAELAWVVGTVHQGNGYGRESALALTNWLRRQGIARLIAHVHPQHTASRSIARALGLTATDTTVDGETRWSSSHS